MEFESLCCLVSLSLRFDPTLIVSKVTICEVSVDVASSVELCCVSE